MIISVAPPLVMRLDDEQYPELEAVVGRRVSGILRLLATCTLRFSITRTNGSLLRDRGIFCVRWGLHKGSKQWHRFTDVPASQGLHHHRQRGTPGICFATFLRFIVHTALCIDAARICFRWPALVLCRLHGGKRRFLLFLRLCGYWLCHAAQTSIHFRQKL